MFSSTIGAFESVWTWFVFLGFKAWRIDLVVGFAVPTEFAMVLRLMRSIVLYAF